MLWLHDNNIEMYSRYSAGDSVVAERINRTFKSQDLKAYQYGIKNFYIERLDEIVDKHNKSYHRKIRIKPADFNPSSYINYGVEHNDKDAIF